MRKQAKLLANFLDDAKVLRQMREFFEPYEGLIRQGKAENRRRQKFNGRQMVYAIRNESGHVKIGYTNNLEARYIALSISSSLALEIIWSADGGTTDERWLHQRFRERHIRGEWFDFSDHSVQDAAQEIASEFDAITVKNVNKSSSALSDSDTMEVSR